jgi:2-dehydropantoate 2-reductase
MALRLFADVHGMCVNLPASHLEPGVVECYSTPRRGILDVGRSPDGRDTTDERLAADLVAAGFLSDPVSDVMARKYGKLLLNLGNVMEAAVGSRDTGDVYQRARAEAEACYAAAGIRAVTEVDPRREQMRMARVEGERRAGGSTWQSLARGSRSTEADHLNGEIVLLGRQHGIPTPVNEGLQRLARHLVSRSAAPGSLSSEQLLDAVRP